MSITALPAAPLRTDAPAVFVPKADAFVAALAQFQTEANALGAQASTDAGTASSQATSAAASAASALAQASAAAISAGQAAAFASAPAYNDTSTTSLAIGLGTKVFTVTAGKSWGAGMSLKMQATTGNSMTGTVTSYTSTTLTMNVLSVTGSGTFSSWAIGPAPLGIVGTGGAIGNTGSFTLTSGSSSLQSVIPTAPGLYATLPDATVCLKGVTTFAISNDGEYDFGIKNAAGTQLGWVRPHSMAIVGLADNTTSAGQWSTYGVEKIGVTANYMTLASVSGGVASNGAYAVIAIDATRTCFVFGVNNCYAIVYDSSTQTWGAIATVRTSIGTAFLSAILSAANQVLIATCSATTAVEMVTLSISGTTITVNSGTKGTLTLAGNMTSVYRLIAVGASFVFSYTRSATVSVICAATISGTTVTIGAESLLSGTNSGVFTFASGSVVRTISAAIGVTTLYSKPFTVSGTTLTAGTEASITWNSSMRAFVNGNGNILIDYILGSTHNVAISKLTGTVEVLSTVAMSATSTTGSVDIVQITSSKTLYTSANASAILNFNIVTDTAGTPSVGTEVITNIPGIPQSLGLTGTTARVGITTNSSELMLLYVDCSGSSPVVTPMSAMAYDFTNLQGGIFNVPDNYFVREYRTLIAGTSVYRLGNIGGRGAYDLMITPTAIRRIPVSIVPAFGGGGATGSASNESWVATTIGNGIQITRVEAAQ